MTSPARALLVSLLLTGCAARGAAPQETPGTSPSSSPAGAGTPSSSYVEKLHARLGPHTPLSLDAHLQSAAESAIQKLGKPGAIVAVEPESGSVQAIYSVPGERGDPLLVAHIPASTFKTFAAIAGLE